MDYLGGGNPSERTRHGHGEGGGNVKLREPRGVAGQNKRLGRREPETVRFNSETAEGKGKRKGSARTC
jgi:hypothetical protein